MNASKTEALRNNAGEDLREFIGANNAFWFDGNGVIANSTADQDGFEDVSTAGGINPSQSVPNGQPVQEMVKWRYNLVKQLQLHPRRAQRLQRRRRHALAGQSGHRVSSPEVGRRHVGLRYRAALFWAKPHGVWRLGWLPPKVRLGQIRVEHSDDVRNVFGSDRLIPVTAQPNGAIASARIPNPNIWSVTNTFSF
jgi:hypothetical protein